MSTFGYKTLKVCHTPLTILRCVLYPTVLTGKEVHITNDAEKPKKVHEYTLIIYFNSALVMFEGKLRLVYGPKPY